VGDFAAVPILENEALVACVVVRVVDDEPAAIPVASAAPTAPPARSAPAMPRLRVSPAAATPTAPSLTPETVGTPSTGMSVHEFQPLRDDMGSAMRARPSAHVAERRAHGSHRRARATAVKVRDIVGLRPGSVVELDRAAGSPVDVLVNGTLVWHAKSSSSTKSSGSGRGDRRGRKLMASASTLILFVRLILSLAVVIGLMWVAANVLRKRGFTGVAGRRGARGPELELLARRPLGPKRVDRRSSGSASVRSSSASPITR